MTSEKINELVFYDYGFKMYVIIFKYNYFLGRIHTQSHWSQFKWLTLICSCGIVFVVGLHERKRRAVHVSSWSINPLMLTAAKSSLSNLIKSFRQKHIQENI